MEAHKIWKNKNWFVEVTHKKSGQLDSLPHKRGVLNK